MKTETVKYITLIKMIKERTEQDRIFHMIHMELEDSMVVKNVRKISDSHVTFSYMGNPGKVRIEGFNVTLDYNGIAKNIKSYNEVVTILCRS